MSKYISALQRRMDLQEAARVWGHVSQAALFLQRGDAFSAGVLYATARETLNYFHDNEWRERAWALLDSLWRAGVSQPVA